jgi:aryl sulfotransferase
MQHIVGMLIFKSAEPRSISESSPWLDMRLGAPIESVLMRAEAQKHRRFLKTHLPFDALTIYEGAKFIHVARDGRDAAMSLHNHLFNFTTDTLGRLSEISRADPKFGDDYPPVPESPEAYFKEWVVDGGSQGDEGSSFFHVENSYWAQRTDSNVLLVHYNDLRTDRAGEMRRVADFLEIKIPDALWPEIIAAAGFDAMKAQGDKLIPSAQMLWQGGPSRFLNKGTNGRWQEAISVENLARYDAQVNAHFAPDLARWVAGGRIGASR